MYSVTLSIKNQRATSLTETSITFPSFQVERPSSTVKHRNGSLKRPTLFSLSPVIHTPLPVFLTFDSKSCRTKSHEQDPAETPIVVPFFNQYHDRVSVVWKNANTAHFTGCCSYFRYYMHLSSGFDVCSWWWMSIIQEYWKNGVPLVGCAISEGVLIILQCRLLELSWILKRYVQGALELWCNRTSLNVCTVMHFRVKCLFDC